jgi:hypothetical protein
MAWATPTVTVASVIRSGLTAAAGHLVQSAFTA